MTPRGLAFLLALWGFSLTNKVAHELLCEAVCADGGQTIAYQRQKL